MEQLSLVESWFNSLRSSDDFFVFLMNENRERAYCALSLVCISEERVMVMSRLFGSYLLAERVGRRPPHSEGRMLRLVLIVFPFHAGCHCCIISFLVFLYHWW